MMDFVPGPVLVVSPHLDDAVFSCWSLLEDFGADVMTVFAGMPAKPVLSPWDCLCGFADSDDAMKARYLEDDEALSGMSHERVQLPLLEAGYRIQQEHPHLDTEIFTAALDKWISAHSDSDHPPIIVLPAGAGLSLKNNSQQLRQTFVNSEENQASTSATHFLIHLAKQAKHQLFLLRKRILGKKGLLQNGDHVLVRDIGLAHLGSRDDVRIFVYEELPYLWSQSAENALSALNTTHVKWVNSPISLAIDQESKFRAVSAYRSQVGPLDPVRQRLGKSETLPKQERFWQLIRSK